jgi:hypothetical protein
MTEPIVYFGIGFFVAALLGLLIGLRDRHRAPHLGSIDQFHADVRQLEEQLAVALGERSKLQREIAVIKHDAEATWAAERVESALFREQINDVAYEIVQITQSLERLGSSIEPMSAPAAPVMRTPRSIRASDEAAAPTMHTGALADRIHALRMMASRADAN